MSAMEKLLAAFSPSFELALKAGEQMSPDRFSSFLKRIAESLYLKSPPFTPEEEAKLLRRLSLDGTSLQALVAACSLALQAADEYVLAPDQLRAALLAVSTPEWQADTFHAVWQDKVSDVRQRSAASRWPVLTHSTWHLHLCAARGGSCGQCQCQSLNSAAASKNDPISSSAATAASAADAASSRSVMSTGATDTGATIMPALGDVPPFTPVGVLDLRLRQGDLSKAIQMEFTFDELYRYYLELERIQEHLDAMG